MVRQYLVYRTPRTYLPSFVLQSIFIRLLYLYSYIHTYLPTYLYLLTFSYVFKFLIAKPIVRGQLSLLLFFVLFFFFFNIRILTSSIGRNRFAKPRISWNAREQMNMIREKGTALLPIFFLRS